MTKQEVDELYAIQQEKEIIDQFIDNYSKKPRNINLGLVKLQERSVLSFKIKGYGILSKAELAMPTFLTGKIMELVWEYRRELVDRQEEIRRGE